MKRSNDEFLSQMLEDAIRLSRSSASLEAELATRSKPPEEIVSLLNAIAAVQELKTVPPRPVEIAAKSRDASMAQVHANAAAATPVALPRSVSHLKREELTLGERIDAWLRSLAEALFPNPIRIPAGMIATVMLVLVLGVGATGAVSASARALPGDPLYWVKTASENISLLFTFDPSEHDALNSELAERRLLDVQAAAVRGRSVASLPFEGTIEEMGSGEWRISGVLVRIDGNTLIEGTPWVGARVSGRVFAPGDRSLVALHLEVIGPPPAASAPSEATPEPVAVVVVAPTRAELPPATATDVPTVDPVELPPLPFGDPAETPSIWVEQPVSSPSPAPTATATRTRVPTAAPTRTATPISAIVLPTTRPEVKFRIEGTLTAMGSPWTVEGTSFEVNGSTQFAGEPAIGARVSALLLQRSGELPLALAISVLQLPDAPPEPYQFTDIVESISGDFWTIGGITVKVDSETALVNDPGLGDLCNVKALRYASGEIVARSIEAIRDEPFALVGTVEELSGSHLVVSGNFIEIGADTQVIGDLAVGKTVQVAGVRKSDGRLVANTIQVVEEETPTPEVEPTPTATDEPASAPTPTTEPVGEPSPTPTSAAAGLPTPVESPVGPDPTPEPEPTTALSGAD